MYRKQMVFQKIICFLCLASGVVSTLYALGLMTDLYDMLYFMIPYPEDPSSVKVKGAMIYYDMQDFNRILLKVGIGLILMAVLLLVTNTHTRRRYYFANYAATGLYAAANIAAAAWGREQITAFKDQYLTTVDFKKLQTRLKNKPGVYTESTFWFDIHKAVYAFALVCVLLLVLNMLWKIWLMYQEKKTIRDGKAVFS